VTLTPIAGTNYDGYNGNGTPATSYQLWGPAGLALDASGNLYIADRYNNRVRELSGTTISTYCGSTGNQTQNGGLNHPGGVAVGQSGNVFISDSLNSVVWNGCHSGSPNQLPYAGNRCGVAGFSGDTGPAETDGPAGAYNCTSPWSGNPSELNQPAGIAVDPDTGNLYMADQYNCRVREVSGTISTVAGNGTCGFSGDGGAATSAELNSPGAVVASGGKIYIADTANSRIRVVDANNNISTLVSGVGGPKGLAVDTVGNVYVGLNDGTIRRINPSGSMSTVATLPASPFNGTADAVQGLARDMQGNLYVSGIVSRIYKITGYNSSASISSISAGITTGNPLYTMNVSFNLSGVVCPAKIRVTIGSSLTRYKQLCNAGDTAPTSGSVNNISVLSLNPVTSYTVTATVDDNNGTSPQASGTLTTPQVPVWVGVGDSYSSGHHQDQDEPCNLNGTLDSHSFQYAAAAYALNGTWDGTCLATDGSGATSLTPNDTSFSWVQRARDQLMSRLSVPSQWTMLVDNVAHSGALAQNYTQAGPESNTCNGCGEKDEMVSALQARAGSWNIVSISGGGNDANLEGILHDFYSSTQGQGQPWVVTDRSTCPNTDQMDTNIQNVSQGVHDALTNVLSAARTTDSNVRLVAITYPYILNPDSLTSVCGGDWTGATPHIGVFHAVDDMDSIITGLAVSGLQVVDLRTAGGFATNPLNDIQQTRYFGYPHPNADGQTAIASAVVGKLLG